MTLLHPKTADLVTVIITAVSAGLEDQARTALTQVTQAEAAEVALGLADSVVGVLKAMATALGEDPAELVAEFTQCLGQATISRERELDQIRERLRRLVEGGDAS